MASSGQSPRRGKIEDFRARGAKVEFGAFGENIVAEDSHFPRNSLSERVSAPREAVSEITQIGKKCQRTVRFTIRSATTLYRAKAFLRVYFTAARSASVMNSRFLRVAGLTRLFLTLSDKGFRGEREDKSGEKVEAMLKEAGYTVVARDLLPDDQTKIEENLKAYIERGIGLVVTTGGTGIFRTRRHAGSDRGRL